MNKNVLIIGGVIKGTNKKKEIVEKNCTSINHTYQITYIGNTDELFLFLYVIDKSCIKSNFFHK